MPATAPLPSSAASFFSSCKCCSTTRKTWESWLLAQHPERTLEIVLSMGHDEVTSIRHYAGLPFTKADKEAMLEWTSGWAEAR